jgi:hypothetical protein
MSNSFLTFYGTNIQYSCKTYSPLVYLISTRFAIADFEKRLPKSDIYSSRLELAIGGTRDHPIELRTTHIPVY